MKRIIALTVTVLMALSLLCSCDFSSLGGAPNEKELAEACSDINKRISEKHEEVAVTVTVNEHGISLTSKYVIKNELITYTQERLNTLSPSLDLTDATADYKTVISGTATVKDGTVTHIDGEAVTVPETVQTCGEFKLDADDLKNATLENGVLDADIASLSDIFGIQADASDAHVTAEYGSDSLLRITVSYTKDGTSVTVVYEFT
jgi:hypothetical protein